MSLISIPFTYTVGAVIVASQHNSCNSVIYNEFNGNITTANIASNAGIVDTQLAQITTAGKVSGAALTSASSMPSGAGVFPAANVFVSGMIMLWSGTIATIPTGWLLCNGSNSTPDLRNLFVVGADADAGGVAKSTVTGSALQSHATGIVGTHVHPIKTSTTAGGGTTYVRVGVAAAQGVSQDSDNNTSGNSINITAFYALAYIYKS